MDEVERALLKQMRQLAEWDRNDLVQKLAFALADYVVKKDKRRRWKRATTLPKNFAGKEE